MPNIDHYKPQLEQLASHALGQPVKIARISASWLRFTPRLALTDVKIHDRAGVVALRLPKVTAGLSWWSLFAREVRLDALEIERPDLDIRRDDRGRIFVAGIFVDTGKSGDGRGADWVLSQRHIVIRDGRVRWNDAQRNAPELTLAHLNFKLENTWKKHAFALTAVPPATLAAPVDLRGSFTHPTFSRKISDVAQWRGTLYVDVRSPALHGWSAYVDYPIAIEEGSGAVRSWLTLDHQKVVDFSADLHLADVSARLAPGLPMLELVRLDGRVSVQETLQPQASFGPSRRIVHDAFGARGHRVVLTDFSMQTRDGLRLPTTTLSEEYVPPSAGHAERVMLAAGFLDLKTFASLVERMPVPPSQRRMLRDFAPQGVLHDFSAAWQGTYPAIFGYAAKGRFSNLSLQAQAGHLARLKVGDAPAQAAVPAIPGFDHLSGSIDATDRGGRVSLDASDLRLHVPGYFVEPLIGFDKFTLQASWTFKNRDQLLLEIARLSFARQGMHGTLSGRHLMPLNPERGKFLGNIDIVADFTGLDVARIESYLPLATPERLRTWLTGALIGGTLQNATLKLKGDLSRFPFHPLAPESPSAGEFRVAGRIDNGRLNIAPGRLAKDAKSPMWPLFAAIQGNILFDRTRMEIDAKTATVHGVQLIAVRAVIPDLLSADKILSVAGEGRGALQDLVGYVNDSPVLDWIGRFTEETRATGNAVLGLTMQIPLARMRESKVQGSLQMTGNDLTLQGAIPALLQTTGKLEFNEKGVALNAVKANFVGGPVIVSGGSQRDGAIVIRAEGSVTTDGLRHAYPEPAMLRLAEHLSGSARYGATIAVRRKRLEIQVESTLQGLAVDAPAPLKKAASETLPLKFEMASVPGDDGIGMRDEIRVALGSALSARYQRAKSLEKDASWQVLRGGIGVNVPAPQPDAGVSINVSLKTLNIDAWRSLITGITGAVSRKDAATPGRISGVAANVGAGFTSGAAGGSSADGAVGAGLIQYLEPEVLAARATELIVANKRLDNVVVGVSHQNGTWQANIDAAQASGYVTWNEAKAGAGIGRVMARLSSLSIPRTAASDVKDILEGKSTTTQIPELDIIAERFELYGKKMGRLELSARNIAAAGTYEWRINRLSLANADAELSATGTWSRPPGGESTTTLAYQLSIANAGKLLERFGYANVLKGGKGTMAGDIGWQGLPFSLDVPSLTGQMHIDVAAGQFLKVDPGAAKLLGVLSLQSLPRRLTLDFRDLFSQGFAFDGITGTVGIAQGEAKTDNLKMRSVAATVVMDGTADIGRETQSLHVAVIPEINVGAASVVYALAVNPVIGLGSFLAQLFLRDPLMRAFTFEYRITGPWTAPQVVRVDRNGKEIPAKPVHQLSSAG